MAARFGWAAVRGRDAMTYDELKLALQLIAEEQVGSPARRAVMEAKAREDAAAAQAAAGARP